MTDNGLWRNFEYGAIFDDPVVVGQIRRDVLGYSALGSTVENRELKALWSAIADLRELSRELERSTRKRLREEFDRRFAAADSQLFRARTAGRTAHAIFADAIIHLLRDGPAETVELNRRIQRIHPDLCDDSVDRIIDGQHFGKKWKHGVRTAQVYLRRSGKIERVDGLWQLTPENP